MPSNLKDPLRDPLTGKQVFALLFPILMPVPMLFVVFGMFHEYLNPWLTFLILPAFYFGGRWIARKVLYTDKTFANREEVDAWY